MRFGFIRQQMKAFPVTVLCRVMQVSRSGFYQYMQHYKNGVQRPEETALNARIRAIFKQHRSKYGSRRIKKQLRHEGHQIGRYKVRRIMRQLSLKAIVRSAQGNKALVEEASGKGYIISRGTFIGVNQGTVIDIQKDRVIVEEEIENIQGDVTLETRELRLPKPSGEE